MKKVQQVQLSNSQVFYIKSWGVVIGLSDGNRIIVHATGGDVGDTRLVKSNQRVMAYQVSMVVRCGEMWGFGNGESEDVEG